VSQIYMAVVSILVDLESWGQRKTCPSWRPQR